MISVCHVDRYDQKKIQKSVDAHFERLQLDRLLSPDKKVLIKPNLLMKRKPEEGTTTHPFLVEAVILRLKKAGVKDITIADSPGGPYAKAPLSAIYRASGMEAVAMATGVKLNQDYTSVEVPQPKGVQTKTFTLIRPVVEADLVISVCKLKTHCMTGMSGAVKNLFGCIPGLLKPELHWRFPEERDFCTMLVDLCETVKPAVTFVDAVVSMEGDGPSSGDLRQTGMTLCGESPYELDLVLSRIINRPTDKIFTITAAAKRGLSSLDAKSVKLCGDRLLTFPDFKQPRSHRSDFMTHVPKPLRPIAEPIIHRFLTPKPVISTKLCVGCGKCAESCPAKTIRIVDKKAHIIEKNCIKCYCCHEMCPVKAISVKRNRILDL